MDSKVVVCRESPRDIKMRDLILQLDDLPEDSLAFGESVEYSVAPGDHRILVTNRLKKQVLQFSLEPGQTVKLLAANVMSRSPLALLMMLTGTIPYRSTIELRNSRGSANGSG